jgi:long-chain acyl-CoA synthetase
MLVFPEGTRSTDGDIHEFKPLLGHLALTYGVDILPIFLGGTRDAMPKGSRVPTRRAITARIGPPLAVADLRRLTSGLTPADAAREVSRLARQAVLALRDGDVLDLARATKEEPAAPKRLHPLAVLFEELQNKFKPGKVEKPLSYYFTLGAEPMAKWTMHLDPSGACDVRVGKPEGFQADCVLKTTAEIFTKIVRESYTPGAAEFLSGAIKSNDVELLQTFQKAFELA